MGRPKRTEFFKVGQFVNPSGENVWRVSGTSPTGTRHRENFRTRGEAIARKGELENLATEPVTTRALRKTALNEDQLTDAEVAIGMLAGRPLAETVGRLLELEQRAKDKSITLNAAVQFAETHYRADQQSISIMNARDQFIESRRYIAPTTRALYEANTKLLMQPDPNKQLHEFTVADIDSILAKYPNNNTLRTVRRTLGTFFRWAVRRRFILEDPCERTDAPPPNMAHVAILDLDEVKRLLKAAMLYHNGTMAASVALGLFAGLRPSEIRDLTPKSINAKGIQVAGGKMRRVLKRSVPLPPVLAAWLKRFPYTKYPANHDGRMRALKKATKAANWVQDVLRHTSISFQLERDKNSPSTAFHCGTSERMIEMHYRNVIADPDVVAEFWSLTPEVIEAAEVEVELPVIATTRWPDNKVLAKLVWQKPLTQLAKDLGMSDVAIRKHCLKAGIEVPAQGHWQRVRAGKGS